MDVVIIIIIEIRRVSLYVIRRNICYSLRRFYRWMVSLRNEFNLVNSLRKFEGRPGGEGKLILYGPLQNLVDLFDYGAHD